MKWKPTPRVKLFEAIGAVADDRIKDIVTDGPIKTAKVYSSSGNKYYDISYDPETSAIMCNDNGSYWKGYLGYPAIAFLMKIGALSYDSKIGDMLKGVAWKDVNQKFDNDFEKAVESVLADKSAEERTRIYQYVDSVYAELCTREFSHLGTKNKPPSGY
ncbi:MAG: hypothetical protein V4481_04240 [Patescibacteria group bacterium]